jgi:hypothetical protein
MIGSKSYLDVLVVPAENLIMKEPTHWTKSPKLPSNSPSFRVNGVAESASAMIAVQSVRPSSLKLSGFDLRLVLLFQSFLLEAGHWILELDYRTHAYGGSSIPKEA